jgi:hypothetical protein
MTDWLTFKQAGEILGVTPRNMRQIPGFGQVRTKPGAPYNGKFYNRADLEKLAEYRKSGQLFQDSYAERQAAKRTRRKSVPPARNGRSVDPLTYRLNRAAIAAQEAAVRSGKLKPKYLPPGQTDY